MWVKIKYKSTEADVIRLSINEYIERFYERDVDEFLANSTYSDEIIVKYGTLVDYNSIMKSYQVEDTNGFYVVDRSMMLKAQKDV